MKLPHGKGRLPPFVPVLKDTMKTPAWKALSHGARSLYVVLKCRYSNSPNVMRWFRELQHYGFIVEVSPAHHGGLCMSAFGVTADITSAKYDVRF